MLRSVDFAERHGYIRGVVKVCKMRMLNSFTCRLLCAHFSLFRWYWVFVIKLIHGVVNIVAESFFLLLMFLGCYS